jgi:hypothetical protein
MDGVVTTLLDKHVRTADGLCACCTKAGQGIPMLPWPCPLWRLARTAQTLGDSRHGPGS